MYSEGLSDKGEYVEGPVLLCLPCHFVQHLQGGVSEMLKLR